MLYFIHSLKTRSRDLRQSASFVYLIRVLSCITLAVSVYAHGAPNTVSIPDGKVTLLQSILVNTTWPNESEIDNFIIGLYGKNRQLTRSLKRELDGFTVRGKPVTITVFDALSNARKAHILVLSSAENSRLAAIENAFKGSQTLIVSDGATNKDRIMVNFTQPDKNRLSFERYLMK